MDLFGEVPCFLNIRSKQLGFLKCELGLRRGLSKSFGEISSFLEHMDLCFSNIGLKIVLKHTWAGIS
jgi:hypothetical protein